MSFSRIVFILGALFGSTLIEGRGLCPPQYELVRWVPKSTHLDLSHQIAAANEKSYNFYIARTAYNGGIIPGKYAPKDVSGVFYFAYNTKELTSVDFEVLMYPKDALIWEKASSSDPLPQNRFLAGMHPFTRGPLFVCRVQHNVDNMIPGQVSDNLKMCIYPYYGFHSSPHFEILVDNRNQSQENNGCGTDTNEVIGRSNNTLGNFSWLEYAVIGLGVLVLVLILMWILRRFGVCFNNQRGDVGRLTRIPLREPRFNKM